MFRGFHLLPSTQVCFITPNRGTLTGGLSRFGLTGYPNLSDSRESQSVAQDGLVRNREVPPGRVCPFCEKNPSLSVCTEQWGQTKTTRRKWWKSVRRESRACRGALPAVEGQAEPKASAPQPRSGDRLVAIRLKPTQDRNGAPQKKCVRVCACLCVCVVFSSSFSLFLWYPLGFNENDWKTTGWPQNKT